MFRVVMCRVALLSSRFALTLYDRNEPLSMSAPVDNKDPSQEEQVRVKLLITGEVQGVFFRASALEQAQSLRITGWVQNLPDGTVELVAEGPRYALLEMCEWCKQGPPDAKVSEVFITWHAFADEFKTFLVVR